jgi:hypothetical protein
MYKVDEPDDGFSFHQYYCSSVVVGCVEGVRVFARGEVETREGEGEGGVREKKGRDERR